MKRFAAELIARTPLTARVHLLRFLAREPFQWAAGQYLTVVRCAGVALELPYSIASAYDPAREGEFEIAAAIHAGADAIDVLELGGEIALEGPAGSFVWQAEPSPAALLIGVGTGIAPLRALIREELARASSVQLVLLAGHRVAEDVLFQDEFSELAASSPRFRFLPTLSAGAAAWSGRRGRVQAQLAEIVRSLGPLDAYVCGRLDMVNEVASELAALGVPSTRIRAEGF
jgi:phenol hydroxylase P5 protein